MPEPSTTSNHAQGNRGRGRGGSSGATSTGPGGPQQNSRGRRGGGRVGRQNRTPAQVAPAGQHQQRSGAPATTGQRGDARDGEPPDPGIDPRPGGTSGDRLTGAAKRAEGEGKNRNSGSVETGAAEDDAEGAEICFICASTIEHTAIAPCNHRTCHICALRLRALYKTKACAHCRTESTFMVFTDDTAKRYEEFNDTDFVRTDGNLGIKYETVDIFEDTVLLLRYNCPDKDCDAACLGWPHLHRHVKSQHGKVMCDLCTRNKKVFTHEHNLFSVSQLRKHERVGDDNPGAVDQSGFKGHPECGFCRERFYGDDELYVHCRDKHERCHICDRRTEYRQHQYYLDYNALEEHFNAEHYLCLDKECLEKKFVVFESQMDLKAHQLEAHPAGVSKDARRDARLVDLSDFDYRSPYQQTTGRRGGAGRGRDPNAEPIPASSAQPLRRDELAYQRQMAIQSAQSASTRTFGGQLTRNEGPTSQPVTRPSQQQAPPTPPTADQSLPPVETLDIGSSAATSTPQEQARRIAHEGVISRAAALLRNDQLKLIDFRAKVSAYRKSAIDATNLIEGFFSLFDTSPAELGKLIKELAHLYEDESKRTSLLQAWNDWRAINEDYPSLPGPSGITPLTSSATGGVGGKRVLRLKSSTGPSSRSAVGQQSSLASYLNSGNSSASELFPPLSSSRPSSKSSKPGAAWGGAAGSAAAAATPSRTSPAPSRSASRTPTTTRPTTSSNSSEAFPALPAAPKPNTLMAGHTRGTIRWDEGPSTAANAWGRSANPTPAEADDDDAGVGRGQTNKKGKGKKGKGKGQVLYHFG